jgi:hypothetical protein
VQNYTLFHFFKTYDKVLIARSFKLQATSCKLLVCEPQHWQLFKAESPDHVGQKINAENYRALRQSL